MSNRQAENAYKCQSKHKHHRREGLEPITLVLTHVRVELGLRECPVNNNTDGGVFKTALSNLAVVGQ